MKAKRTSLEDIAKSVGVSKATVSFVLNGKGDEFNISKEKQRIIKERAKEMSYVPNFFAKSLRQGETKTIGVVVADISNLFYAELCKTIQEELYAKGYNVFIVNTDDDKELEKTLMRELIQRSIDGMIISPSNKIDALIPILNETHIPVVFADRPGDENADFVGVDNFMEAKKLVKAFSAKPKKLAILTQNNNQIVTIENRVAGAKLACEEDGIAYELVILSAEQENVDNTIKLLVNSGVDSFLALNNVVALRTLAGLKNNNVNIPSVARMISFDDSEAFPFVEPPISALSQPVKQIGIDSVARLFTRIKETKTPGEHMMLECKLNLRGSH